MKKNPYQYKKAKKKKAEKEFYAALVKMYERKSKTEINHAGKLTEETLSRIRKDLKRRNKI